MSGLRTIWIVVLLLRISDIYGQADYSIEESVETNLYRLDDLLLDEEAALSFIINNTKTKLGSDFYEGLFGMWLTLQQDTVATLPRQALADQEIPIEVEELPYPGLTGIVGIKIDNELVWQQFIQLRPEAREAQVSEAAQFLFQYLSSYEQIRQQLGSEDQAGTGIF
ncbi:MAG: hypothetical protein ABS46_19605 [Cytophagaceae bacterium SCN 52-12]|nr:MAG: hypothetical protein ABS46_19605 [Cytophagaceae bacterium SCN 52-12]